MILPVPFRGNPFGYSDPNTRPIARPLLYTNTSASWKLDAEKLRARSRCALPKGNVVYMFALISPSLLRDPLGGRVPRSI